MNYQSMNKNVHHSLFLFQNFMFCISKIQQISICVNTFIIVCLVLLFSPRWVLLGGDRNRGVASSLQTKHLMGSNYYNSKLFRYFRYKCFDVKFFILENVIPQMPLSLIYQTRASFFRSTKETEREINTC